MWVPIKTAYPKENLADLAFGYGIPSEIVGGQDVADAVGRALNLKEPLNIDIEFKHGTII